MKKLIFLNLFLLFSFLTAQIKFEKGYYITNNGEKHEALIKNEDWLNNPTEFIYKFSENGTQQIGKIKDIKEFQVYGYNKLVRYTGKIDFSSNDLETLSSTKEPEWREMEVFLYKLSSGEINLYSYYGKTNLRYFYSVNNKEITPLIYKEYYPENSSSTIATNDTFKTQLLDIFSKKPELQTLINNSNYSSNSLLKIFNNYNNVSEDENMESQKKITSKFNLSLKPGINFIKLNIYSPNPETHDAQFKTTEMRLSLEMEYIFPFNKNKWSIIVEPHYLTLKANTISKNEVNTIKINYSGIDFPIGIRHYMFLNQKSKMYTDIKLSLFTIATKEGVLNYTSTYSKFDILLQKNTNLIFSLGYKYNNKFSIEASTALKSSVTANYQFWGSALSYNSISIGYNFF